MGWKGLFAGLLALFTTAFPLLRADVLANSDFSQGRAHWSGDAEDLPVPDDSAASTSDEVAPAGVTVTLKKDRWTMIYQDFTPRDAELYYTITFKLSADYKLAEAGSDDKAAGDFSAVPGIQRLYDVPVGHWALIYTGTDPADADSIKMRALDPDAASTQSQTLTGKLRHLGIETEANLILAFPPGEGSVTLTGVALSPVDPSDGP